MESLQWHQQNLEKSLINIERLIAKHAVEHETPRLLEDLTHLQQIVMQISLLQRIINMAAEISDGAEISGPCIARQGSNYEGKWHTKGTQNETDTD
jgi:hypothetical protein